MAICAPAGPICSYIGDPKSPHTMFYNLDLELMIYPTSPIPEAHRCSVFGIEVFDNISFITSDTIWIESATCSGHLVPGEEWRRIE